MRDSKRTEYIQRGLPHRHKDGTLCQCHECREAIAMGLGKVKVYEDKKPEMLFADPDWKNTQ